MDSSSKLVGREKSAPKSKDSMLKCCWCDDVSLFEPGPPAASVPAPEPVALALDPVYMGEELVVEAVIVVVLLAPSTPLEPMSELSPCWGVWRCEGEAIMVTQLTTEVWPASSVA